MIPDSQGECPFKDKFFFEFVKCAIYGKPGFNCHRKKLEICPLRKLILKPFGEVSTLITFYIIKSLKSTSLLSAGFILNIENILVL